MNTTADQTSSTGGTRPARTGWLIALFGVLFAAAPLVIAIIGGWVTGTNWADESEGWGTLVWLVIVTAPIGAAIVIVGLLIGVVRAIRSR